MRSNLPRKLLRITVLVALSALAVWRLPGVAAGGTPVYDPKPLMAALAEERAARPFTFAVFGDTYAHEDLSRLMEMVEERGADFAVTTGDLVSFGGGPGADGQWRKLADIAGWFMEKHPTWPVQGNHEVRVLVKGEGRHEARRQARANFLDFHGIQSVQYSFTFGNAKFIVLGWDLELDENPPAQVEFLERELAEGDEWEHVFVFRHRPFFAIGEKGPEEVPNRATGMTRLFTKAGIDAVFSGHEHVYYRGEFEGVTYIQAGCGGGVRRLERLNEVLPGASYMGIIDDEFVLHVPGRDDLKSPWLGEELEGAFKFAVMVTVDGPSLIVRTVSLGGDEWESFEIDRGRLKVDEAAEMPPAPAGVGAASR